MFLLLLKKATPIQSGDLNKAQSVFVQIGKYIWVEGMIRGWGRSGNIFLFGLGPLPPKLFNQFGFSENPLLAQIPASHTQRPPKIHS